jgi:hypothetical protein
MNHEKASYGTEIFAGAMIRVAQYVALLQYLYYVHKLHCTETLEADRCIHARSGT